MNQRESGVSAVWILVAVFAVVLIGAAAYFIYQSSQTSSNGTPSATPTESADTTADRQTGRGGLLGHPALRDLGTADRPTQACRSKWRSRSAVPS